MKTKIIDIGVLNFLKLSLSPHITTIPSRRNKWKNVHELKKFINLSTSNVSTCHKFTTSPRAYTPHHSTWNYLIELNQYFHIYDKIKTIFFIFFVFVLCLRYYRKKNENFWFPIYFVHNLHLGEYMHGVALFVVYHHSSLTLLLNFFFSLFLCVGDFILSFYLNAFFFLSIKYDDEENSNIVKLSISFNSFSCRPLVVFVVVVNNAIMLFAYYINMIFRNMRHCEIDK